VIDVTPLVGRHDFGRFIDYAYTRNSGDPHWIPPLRLAERERLSPRHNPFFAHAAVELLLARRHEIHHPDPALAIELACLQVTGALRTLILVGWPKTT